MVALVPLPIHTPWVQDAALLHFGYVTLGLSLLFVRYIYGHPAICGSWRYKFSGFFGFVSLMFVFLLQKSDSQLELFCHPRDPHLTISREFLVIKTGEGVFLASGGWRPRMLLNILHRIAPPPPAKTHLGQSVNRAKDGNPANTRVLKKWKRAHP